jgi:hypothetical protein
MFTKKSMISTIITCVLILCFSAIGVAPTATATTPDASFLFDNKASTIPYSGQLTDPNGKAVADGKYDFTFRVYNAAESGSLLWTEQQAGVMVSAGKFSANLGSVTSLPVGGFDNQTAWLEVSVRGAGEIEFTTLTPRLDLATNSGTQALACPHSHYSDSWTGNTYFDGLVIENNYASNGDGLHAVSNNTDANHGAIYARNDATTGSGDAINTLSDLGVGLRANSGGSDGIDASTYAPLASRKSAVYAHTNSGWGITTVSGATGAVYPNELAAIQAVGTATYNMGAYVTSNQNAGAIIKTNVPGSYVGLLIDGSLNIINGGCTGCVISYIGFNTGTTDIQKGDLVALIGVQVDASTQQPILQVQRASSSADIIIGVSVGPAASPSDPTRSSPATPGKSGAEITAQGEYVQVMISGLAQVRVNSTGISLGSYLTAGSDGMVLTTDAASSYARVMSEVDANGFVWALFGGR